MSRCILSVVVGFSLVFVGGCLTSSSDAKAVFQEQIDAINELTTTLRSVKDKASAGANTAKVKELCDKIELLEQKLNTTRMLKTNIDSLQAEFTAKSKTSLTSLIGEMGRVSAVDGGAPLVSSIQAMLARAAEASAKAKKG